MAKKRADGDGTIIQKKDGTWEGRVRFRNESYVLVTKYCLADTGEIIPEYIRKYNKDGSDLVEIDSRKINEYNVSYYSYDEDILTVNPDGSLNIKKDRHIILSFP